ncbi:MAG: universal stress protein [Haloarculaceae archaeon]
MTHDRILIATDNSEPAQRATAEAITLAESFDATLSALYVLETAEPPPWFEDPATEPGLDTNAGQALNEVVSEAGDRGLEPEVVTAVVRGQTGPAILEYADEHDIDLIVLGTHGRTGFDRLLIGSVAEHVVRKSPVPVVTVR